MKKYSVFLLFLCIAVFLSACRGFVNSNVQDGILFYYLRSEQTYDAQDSVIAAETRNEITAEKPLQYLLTLYLNGPADKRLVSPFPKDFRILELKQDSDTLTVACSTQQPLEGLAYTKACACLAKTCFGLTDIKTLILDIQIEETESLLTETLYRSTFILEDNQ